MDFRDTPDEGEFRAAATQWINETLKEIPNPDGSSQAAREENSRWWQTALYEGGWAGVSWPVEYGGMGKPTVYEAIFNEECARQNTPNPMNMLGLILAGPTIMVHGTDEQRSRFLPPILSGEEVWCQGFSEPSAGSDLASLSSRAELVGDRWVINGQKVWTSFAHNADRCMLLARTESDESSGKHSGITYFLAPTAEFDIRPIVMINGDADFNEMFLSDVSVDRGDVLGPVGGGWRVAMTTLGFERSSLAMLFAVETQHAFIQLSEAVESAGLGDDTDIQAALGGFYADMVGLRIASVRQMSQGGSAPEGSILKLTWAHLMQDMTRLMVQIGGPCAVVDEGTTADPIRRYLRARGNSVEGGTDEIQRSIIAERLVGLPRSR